MINVNGLKLNFAYMGYFVGNKNWIHPSVTIDTYEIIFVTNGQVFIREDDKNYSLNKGDVLLLHANHPHKGYKKSDDASFFWLHFYSENYDDSFPKYFHVKDYHNYELLFRRLNHFASIKANPAIIECELALLFLNNASAQNKSSKLFYDVADYIKINVSKALTVNSVAYNFGYSADHLSKIFIKNIGLSLKKFIDNERNSFVKSLLLNTNLTIKEIAHTAKFIDDKSLIKFFRYNNQQTPTEFRSRNFATHTNNY